MCSLLKFLTKYLECKIKSKLVIYVFGTFIMTRTEIPETTFNPLFFDFALALWFLYLLFVLCIQ